MASRRCMYDVRSRGAESYIRLAKEIMGHYLPVVESGESWRRPAEEMDKSA